MLRPSHSAPAVARPSITPPAHRCSPNRQQARPGYLERDRTDLREWAKQKEIVFHIVHSSGHAASADLYRMAQAVAPQRLLPIHTVHPERYASLSANTMIAANGEWMEL